MIPFAKTKAGLRMLAVCIPLFSVQAKNPNIPLAKVDFLDSMGFNDRKNEGLLKQFFPSGSKELTTLSLFKALYDKNNYFERSPYFENKIPKIIHQIWIGPKAPPKVLEESRKSFKKLHPDWQYKLWTNDDLHFLKLQNRKFFDKSNNWGEKADIMRYEILYQFGGVYVDVDFICFKPLDILCQYDVWACLEPISCALGAGVNNAIIGAIQGHPLLKHCIDKLEKSWYSGTNIWERVGPRHFTKSFIAHAEKGTNNIIALPKSFFYPLDCNFQFIPKEGKAFRNALLGKKSQAKVKSDKRVLDKIIKQESFAMHLWAGTWSK